MGSRARLTNEFIEALAKDWAEHGAEALERVREESPAKYAELVARLVPEEIIVSEPSQFEDIRTTQDFRPFFVQTVLEQQWWPDVLAALGYEPPKTITHSQTAEEENTAAAD